MRKYVCICVFVCVCVRGRWEKLHEDNVDAPLLNLMHLSSILPRLWVICLCLSEGGAGADVGAHTGAAPAQSWGGATLSGHSYGGGGYRGNPGGLNASGGAAYKAESPMMNTGAPQHQHPPQSWHGMQTAILTCASLLSTI